MENEKVINLQYMPVEKSVAMPFILRAAKYDTTAGAQNVDEAIAGSQFFGLFVDGAMIGAYAIKLIEAAVGRIYWVMATGASLRGVCLSPYLLRIYEMQAASMGAVQIATTTKRPAVIKKMIAGGYEVSGVILRKNKC